MLGVYITADSDKLVEAIIHLPTLAELTFLKVFVTKEKSQRYAAINDASNLKNVEPFNSCLKKLVLGSNEYENTSAEFIILLKYLLPRLPALRDLAILNGPHKLVSEAVYELGLKYSYLSNIKIS
ncbi:hypothetical protein COEREDRAFT_85040 [Coemansia reversa NRRL 1564]|uniref:FBD domain-containing protein n=1 Tax=Coemansia reversa (strain ATCC 12441 / NRRL 1564) TaxID=763665 RepID=A0A2G5BHU8_COERN|nr:hypothetical protein COEREDRAFT_85040 [Coemansia reversa NRRL 1564]|eukprot:PIA18561.1 hypothetical protein COEREDRAFT_85040 [Coemansia reversa NRRL 1564]